MKNDYWYDLPEGLIAQYPATPRDSSKLLVYDTQNNSIIIDVFKNLATHLPPSTTLTLNDAKVVPARVTMHKESGGKITVLFLINEWISKRSGPIPCFLDRRGRVGEKLFFADKSFCTIQSQEEGLFFLSWEGKSDDLLKKLDNYGTMPIPPYIKHSPLSRDELLEKYQTVFAKRPGSSAAPTASLHFTPEVFASLEALGIKKQYITLHVGLGTFAPLTEENLRTKTLHHETYEISHDVAESLKLKAPTFAQATAGKESQKQAANNDFRYIDISKNIGMDITAVGTTVVRTLESLALSFRAQRSEVEKSQEERSLDSKNMSKVARDDKQTQRFIASTDLFISPPFEFKVVDHLITNFHLPGSSLMMLVDAFLASKGAKRRILDLYRFAIEHELRFYSFGDAMLIL